MRIPVMVWALVAALAGARQETRLPVPDAAAQKKAETLIRDVFRDEYSRKDPVSRRALVQKLVKQAAETQDDPVTRYVLLREARDIAAEVGDVKGALQAVQDAAASYVMDLIAARKQILERLRKTATADQFEALAEAHLQLAEEAVAADDYDAALAALRDGEQLTQKAKNLPLLSRLRARGKEVARLKADHALLAEARKKLDAQPADPDASLVVGRHLCFVKGDWGKGLPLLAAGSDAALKALADKDLANPADPAARMEAGDGWWELGVKEDAVQKARLWARAAFWYVRSLPAMTGLSRAKIEKRLAEMNERGIAFSADVEAPSSGLIGWWKLDEGSGDRVSDSTAKGSHGRLVKGTAWTEGRFGGGLSFDGIDDHVGVPWTAGKGVADSFTMSVWAFPKATRKTTPEANAGSSGGGGQRYAIWPPNAGFDYGPGHSFAGISIGTNGISVFEHAPSYLPSLLVQETEIKDWVHVTVVYQDRQPKLYVNGKFIKAGLKSLKIVHPGTFLGEGGAGYGYYSGILDEVRLYDRVLAEVEIATLAAPKRRSGEPR